MPVSVRSANTPADIETIVLLAREIWREHYQPIIGSAQVEYMLAHFQDVDAIQAQIEEGHEYFLITSQGKAQGYMSLVKSPHQPDMKLSKIYVRKSRRGEGLGRAALNHAETLCRSRGFECLWLTVNRHNAKSIAWYKNRGFSIAGPIIADIGGGFVMDDYRLEKRLHRDRP